MNPDSFDELFNLANENIQTLSENLKLLGQNKNPENIQKILQLKKSLDEAIKTLDIFHEENVNHLEIPEKNIQDSTNDLETVASISDPILPDITNIIAKEKNFDDQLFLFDFEYFRSTSKPLDPAKFKTEWGRKLLQVDLKYRTEFFDVLTKVDERESLLKVYNLLDKIWEQMIKHLKTNSKTEKYGLKIDSIRADSGNNDMLVIVDKIVKLLLTDEVKMDPKFISEFLRLRVKLEELTFELEKQSIPQISEKSKQLIEIENEMEFLSRLIRADPSSTAKFDALEFKKSQHSAEIRSLDIETIKEQIHFADLMLFKDDKIVLNPIEFKIHRHNIILQAVIKFKSLTKRFKSDINLVLQKQIAEFDRLIELRGKNNAYYDYLVSVLVVKMRLQQSSDEHIEKNELSEISKDKSVIPIGSDDKLETHEESNRSEENSIVSDEINQESKNSKDDSLIPETEFGSDHKLVTSDLSNISEDNTIIPENDISTDDKLETNEELKDNSVTPENSNNSPEKVEETQMVNQNDADYTDVKNINGGFLIGQDDTLYFQMDIFKSSVLPLEKLLKMTTPWGEKLLSLDSKYRAEYMVIITQVSERQAVKEDLILLDSLIQKWIQLMADSPKTKEYADDVKINGLNSLDIIYKEIKDGKKFEKVLLQKENKIRVEIEKTYHKTIKNIETLFEKEITPEYLKTKKEWLEHIRLYVLFVFIKDHSVRPEGLNHAISNAAKLRNDPKIKRLMAEFQKLDLSTIGDHVVFGIIMSENDSVLFKINIQNYIERIQNVIKVSFGLKPGKNHDVGLIKIHKLKIEDSIEKSKEYDSNARYLNFLKSIGSIKYNLEEKQRKVEEQKNLESAVDEESRIFRIPESSESADGTDKSSSAEISESADGTDKSSSAEISESADGTDKSSSAEISDKPSSIQSSVKPTTIENFDKPSSSDSRIDNKKFKMFSKKPAALLYNAEDEKLFQKLRGYSFVTESFGAVDTKSDDIISGHFSFDKSGLSALTPEMFNIRQRLALRQMKIQAKFKNHKYSTNGEPPADNVVTNELFDDNLQGNAKSKGSDDNLVNNELFEETKNEDSNGANDNLVTTEHSNGSPENIVETQTINQHDYKDFQPFSSIPRFIPSEQEDSLYFQLETFKKSTLLPLFKILKTTSPWGSKLLELDSNYRKSYMAIVNRVTKKPIIKQDLYILDSLMQNWIQVMSESPKTKKYADAASTYGLDLIYNDIKNGQKFENVLLKKENTIRVQIEKMFYKTIKDMETLFEKEITPEYLKIKKEWLEHIRLVRPEGLNHAISNAETFRNDPKIKKLMAEFQKLDLPTMGDHVVFGLLMSENDMMSFEFKLQRHNIMQALLELNIISQTYQKDLTLVLAEQLTEFERLISQKGRNNAYIEAIVSILRSKFRLQNIQRSNEEMSDLFDKLESNNLLSPKELRVSDDNFNEPESSRIPEGLNDQNDKLGDSHSHNNEVIFEKSNETPNQMIENQIMNQDNHDLTKSETISSASEDKKISADIIITNELFENVNLASKDESESSEENLVINELFEEENLASNGNSEDKSVIPEVAIDFDDKLETSEESHITDDTSVIPEAAIDFDHKTNGESQSSEDKSVIPKAAMESDDKLETNGESQSSEDKSVIPKAAMESDDKLETNGESHISEDNSLIPEAEMESDVKISKEDMNQNDASISKMTVFLSSEKADSLFLQLEIYKSSVIPFSQMMKTQSLWGEKMVALDLNYRREYMKPTVKKDVILLDSLMSKWIQLMDESPATKEYADAVIKNGINSLDLIYKDIKQGKKFKKTILQRENKIRVDMEKTYYETFKNIEKMVEKEISPEYLKSKKEWLEHIRLARPEGMTDAILNAETFRDDPQIKGLITEFQKLDLSTIADHVVFSILMSENDLISFNTNIKNYIDRIQSVMKISSGLNSGQKKDAELMRIKKIKIAQSAEKTKEFDSNAKYLLFLKSVGAIKHNLERELEEQETAVKEESRILPIPQISNSIENPEESILVDKSEGADKPSSSDSRSGSKKFKMFSKKPEALLYNAEDEKLFQKLRGYSFETESSGTVDTKSEDVKSGYFKSGLSALTPEMFKIRQKLASRQMLKSRIA